MSSTTHHHRPDEECGDEQTNHRGSERVRSHEGVEPYDPADAHAFPDHRVNQVLQYVTSDERIQAYLEAQNVNPAIRKQYNDHGAVHVSIVRNRALHLYDLLKRHGIAFNGAREQGLDEADESVIIALAATLHDIGHVVHRHRHAYYSVPLAANVLEEVLPEFYDTADAVRVKGEVLHAILCHHSEETPLTREAGVLRIADALDMEQGRSRLPYAKGRRGIDTVSSQAIERVTLMEGNNVPVLVEIEMHNAAGVYQVDTLLKAKLRESGLEDLFRVVAINGCDDNNRIIERIEL